MCAHKCRLTAPFSGRPQTLQHAGAHDLFKHPPPRPRPSTLSTPDRCNGLLGGIATILQAATGDTKYMPICAALTNPRIDCEESEVYRPIAFARKLELAGWTRHTHLPRTW